MENWKFILACLSLGLIVWLLYPSRSLTHQNEENVVEIFYMGPLGPIADGMAEAVAVFEQRSLDAHRKDPNKPIYRVISGQTAAKDQVADPTRFLISVAGGMPPDVIYFDRFAIAEWAARGAFDPLDPFIAADIAGGRTDTPNKNDFYQAAWAESVYGGKQYGIPCSMDNRALFCNVDLLLRAGLVDETGNPKPPGTWEEFLEYCKKLCEYDESGRLVRAGFVPDWRQSWLAQHAWANGAEFLSADGKTVLLNSPEVLGAVKFLRAAADVQGGFEKLSGFKASFQGDAQDPFYTGKLAMVLEGVWALDGMATFARDVRFITAPMPRPKKFVDAGAPPMSFCGGWAYAIPTNARNKQAAWEFIRFMAGEEATRIQIEADRVKAEAEGRPFMPKQQPLIKLTEWSYDEYVARNDDLPAQFKSGAKVFNDLLPHSRFRPITPVGQLLWNEQRNALQSALYGLRTPERALSEGNDIVQRALDRVLAPPTGRPIQSWGWFFTLYGVLLAIGAAVAYFLHIRKHPSGTLTRRQWPGGLISASPWLIGFVIFGGGPMLYSLVMSFCDYDVLNPPRFIGGENYQRILTDDPTMPAAIWNTAYMLIAVPLQMIVSLIIALLLNRTLRAMAFWRTMFYLPAIVPMVASAVLWVWVLNPEGGLINLALRSVGIVGPQWLQSTEWSKPSLILMKLWAAGGGMIIWLAGLKSIPASLYEAAEVDGANQWQQFWAVTVPQLTPYIFFNLIMGLIGTFQIFTESFVMTQGGPVNSTLFYVYHLFNNAFRFGNMGYASAMAWVLFAIVLVLTAVQLRTSRRWVHYEAE